MDLEYGILEGGGSFGSRGVGDRNVCFPQLSCFSVCGAGARVIGRVERLRDVRPQG